MLINTDINILGGLPDLNLINYFLFRDKGGDQKQLDYYSYTAIKTDKSVKRFERAITRTLLQFKTEESTALVKSMLASEAISHDSLLLLFWHASSNNDLLNHLNNEVYFPAFYSGRIILKNEEVYACINGLKETEEIVQDWTKGTMETVARKYLTLLKKFNLMEGATDKKILHPYLGDKMFVLFVYWLSSTETKSNLIESPWLKYSFSELPVFLERVMQKRFAQYFNITYTGDKLTIETILPYENIYDALK